MLRGLVRSRKHWGPFYDRVQAAFPDREIITLDIPGNGELNKEESFTEMRRNVEYLRDALKAKVGNRKGDLLAISLGGMISFEWMKRYPNDFEHAILVNTSLKGVCPLHYRMKISSFLKLVKTRLTSSIAKRENAILKIISNDTKKHPVVLEKNIQLAYDHPVSSKNAARQIWSAITYKPDLEMVPQPKTLILGSHADQLVSGYCSEKIAAHWKLECKMHNNAGHELQLDDPDWVLTHMKHWYAT